ncbi:MAG TPA: endo-1,4-beta-xylanase [Lacunisphaera sp.]|nr:endo-1,4-beta-xylanase [Lacunisphaera sp.]
MPPVSRALPRLFAFAAAAAAALPALASPTTAELDASIRKNRMGTLIVLAPPGTPIKVAQTRHEFWFGAALTSGAFNGRLSPADTERYRAVFLANFNAAVTENALKWLDMEPQQGVVNYGTVAAILDWTKRNHLPLRGHNVFWGVPKWVQPWVQSLDNDSLHRTLEARARDIGSRYRGMFAEYDLNNEMIHGNYYADRLGPGITLEMARWLREEDPDARLFVNDYDILTGKRLDDYVAHIRSLLAMGVPLAGIGVQGHLHADTFDREELQHALDVLAQFHLPIRITEFNLPGQRSVYYEHRELTLTEAQEEARARDLADYYRICFAHPAVAGILMWGFWEGADWIPASALYRRDWSPTPSALAYRDLVFRQWWTNWEGQAGSDGRCVVPAFFGQYEVTIGGRTTTTSLRQQDGTTTVSLP